MNISNKNVFKCCYWYGMEIINRPCLCYDLKGGLRMGKRVEVNKQPVILDLKTGINLYRFAIMLFPFPEAISMFIAYTILAPNKIIEIIVCLFISIACILIIIFMNKIVYFLKLPTNHLIISKDEITYKKGKKESVYKIDEVNYKFHSFFEDFEHVPLLEIISDDKAEYVAITKKQFNLMKQFLKDVKADS